MALLRQLSELKTDAPGIAPLADRIRSNLIDLILLAVALAVATTVWSVIANALGHVSTSSTTGLPKPDRFALIGFDLVMLTGVLVYELGPALFGKATPGKTRLGLHVVDADGNGANFQRHAIRFFAWFVPLIALTVVWSETFPDMWSLLAFLGVFVVVLGTWTTIWRADDDRGWHDRLAGTAVLSDR